MDSEYIEQLLQRYWKCKTSTAEEAQLRDFFTQEEVPAHLLRYKALFDYQQRQQQLRVSPDFDARLLARMKATRPAKVKARRISHFARLAPLARAAAVIAIMAGLGNLMQRSFFADNAPGTVADTIGNQIAAPSVALSQEAADACGTQQPDSLQPSVEPALREKITVK